MNNKIIKFSDFDLNKLDKQNYLQSIINVALNSGLISIFQAENFQIQILRLLSEVLNKYTSSESSSVKIETAQDILCSIVYCIDYFLICNNDFEKSLKIIKDNKISDVYLDGKNLIKNDVLKAKNLFKKVKNSRISIDLIAYNDTIDNAIDYFFINYDINYAAHDTCALIDYPLAYDSTDQRGISYIIQYLNKLYFENEFCRRFFKKDIINLLKQYGDIYNFDYKDMLINVFNLVLYNSCFSVIMQKNPKKLEILESECKSFQDKINSGFNIDFKKIESILYAELIIEDYEMKKYMNICINRVLNNIISFAKDKKLHFILTVKKQIKEIKKIYFEDKIQMTNELFQALNDELCNIYDGSKKAKIILEKVKSFNDLIDLLCSYCIFENEYIDVFNAFDDLTLAHILKRINYDLFFVSIDNIGIEDLHISEHEKQWQSKFYIYLKSIKKARLNKILKLAEKICD